MHRLTCGFAVAAAMLLSPREPLPRASAGERTIAALTPATDGDHRFDFMRERRQKGTRLTRAGSAPELYRDPETAAGTRLVRYPAVVGELKAWMLMPEHERLRTSSGYPALIYVHDGWAVSAHDLEHAGLFARAGLLVLVPAWRGENGNPGPYELLFGELEDLTAAVHYSAAQPEVDAARIGLFGHGMGGMLSALAALHPDLPLHETASSAGLFSDDVFEHLAPPFKDSAGERRMRLVGPHLEHLRIPHLACVGLDDTAVLSVANELHARAREIGAPLTVLTEAGARTSSRVACERRYVKRLVQRFAPAAVRPVVTF